MFTNKRLIFVDKQGFTGKKVEHMSVVYKSISRFSIETAGSFDLDAELKSGCQESSYQVFKSSLTNL